MQLNVTKIERHTGGHLVAHLTLPGEPQPTEYVFVDDPYLDPAPVYQQLVAALRAGEFDAIIENVV